MHRRDLLQHLNHYHTSFIEEKAMLGRTRHFVMQHKNCFDRNLSVGHISGSAWIVNPARSHVLLMHHRKLGLWLQPGGHADGDPDITRVVLKEASEETGINLQHIKLLSNKIFDVDVHTVYASIHDPRHEHFDIRFLVEIDDQIPIPGNNESHDIGWINLNDVSRYNNALSFHRLIKKTRLLAKARV